MARRSVIAGARVTALITKRVVRTWVVTVAAGKASVALAHSSELVTPVAYQISYKYSLTYKLLAVNSMPYQQE